MASILDRYGIKEVADVTFYDIESDGSRGAPVLFLDTLKVSTIEQTAEQAEARGGKGNPPLIIWDYGKEITVTLEDALFSAKSMAIMFGDGKVGDSGTIIKTWSRVFTSVPTDSDKFEYGGKTINYGQIKQKAKFYSADGLEVTPSTKTPAAFLTAEIPVENVGVIEISSNSFPGTYYVTGDTYARSETTGKDEFFQFIIQKAKVQSENTITLEAEGDPSVFNMSLRVLRPADGKMMKLVKYDVSENEIIQVLTLEGSNTVAEDSTITLTAKLNGTNVTADNPVVYASSDGDIAQVENGTVTGKKAGSTTIYAYLAKDAETHASFNVTVTPKAAG